MLSVFEFDSKSVRVLAVDGDPWFVAMDIAYVLGYADPAEMTNLVDDEDKQVVNPHKLDNGKYTETFNSNAFRVSIVNESGCYACIFGSTKPNAKAFKRLVTSEILPSIRKTGGYSVAEQPKQIMPTHAEALRGWADSLDENKILRAEKEKNAPLVEFAEKVAVAVNQISIADMAKILGTGQNKLFASLRELGIIQKGKVIPYQKYVDEQWFVITEFTKQCSTGVRAFPTTRVTGKGQIKIAELLGKQATGNGIVTIGKKGGIANER